MPTPELPNVWVAYNPHTENIDAYDSSKERLEMLYRGGIPREFHEYAQATKAKVLRAALEQAEADIRDLRAAIEKSVAELNLLADAADRERVPGWCAVDPGAARSVADDLEAALKPRGRA